MSKENLERIHLPRINKVSRNVIEAFRVFSNPEYYEILLKVHQGFNTSQSIATDTEYELAKVSAILSVLKRKGILKSAKKRDGRFSQYSFDTHMMRKIKLTAKINW